MGKKFKKKSSEIKYSSTEYTRESFNSVFFFNQGVNVNSTKKKIN